jgi:hypothetical protein
MMALRLALGFFAGAALALSAGLLIRYFMFHPRHAKHSQDIATIKKSTFNLWLRLRPQLAEAVGSLLGDEKLLAATLKERLSDPAVHDELAVGIAERLELFFEMEVSSLLDSADIARGGDLGSLAGEATKAFVASEAFSQAVTAALSRAVSIVTELPLSSLLPVETVGTMTRDLLSPSNLDRLDGLIKERLRAQGNLAPRISGPGSAQRPSTLSPLLEPFVPVIVDSLYSAAVPLVEGFLNDVETRQTIGTSALEIVRRAVSRLNVLQRLIVGAANYERSLAETMPEAIEDLVDMVSRILRSSSMRERVLATVQDLWHGQEGEGIEGLGALWATLVQHQALETALAQAVDALGRSGPELAERVSELVARHPDASLSSLLGALGIDPSHLAEAAAPGLTQLLRASDEAASFPARAVKALASAFLGSLAPRRLSGLLGVDTVFRDNLATVLAERGLELVAAESETIVRGLGLREEAIARINAIDETAAQGYLQANLGGVSRAFMFSLMLLGGFSGAAAVLVSSLIPG